MYLSLSALIHSKALHKLGGRHLEVLAEDLCEVLVVAKAHLLGHLVDAQPPLAQQGEALLQAVARDERVEGVTGLIFELAREVARGYAESIRSLLDAQPLPVVRGDEPRTSRT